MKGAAVLRPRVFAYGIDRHFPHLHQFPFAQRWHFYRRRCEEHLVPLQQKSQPGRPTPVR